MNTTSPISESTALILWDPPQSPEEFLRSEIEKRTDQAYKRTLDLEKNQGTEDRLLAGLTEPQRQVMADLVDLHRNGLIDGEVLIAKGDRPVLHLRGTAVTANENAQFMIGSVTKQFFAVALLKILYNQSPGMTDQEKVAHVKEQLHRPISQFLPAEADIWGGKMPDWATTVTLHHLLSHTSGIPDHTAFAKDRFLESPRSARELIGLISEENPGKLNEFSYSNTNYLIVAEVIETLTGGSSSEYMRRALFEPIGLTSTANPMSGNSVNLRSDKRFSKLVPERTYDVCEDGANTTSPEQYEDVSSAIGSGSMISSVQDLLKWNLALHKNRSILSPALYELFTTENKDQYCYGMFRDSTKSGLSLMHDGAINTYRTKLKYLPESQLSIIVLTNTRPEYKRWEEMFDKRMIELEKEIPDQPTRIQQLSKEMHQKFPDLSGFQRIQDVLTRAF